MRIEKHCCSILAWGYPKQPDYRKLKTTGLHTEKTRPEVGMEMQSLQEEANGGRQELSVEDVAASDCQKQTVGRAVSVCYILQVKSGDKTG